MLTFDLDQLGWVDFEELVQTLLLVRLGLGVEGWGGSGDWGRDAYCVSPLKYPSNEITDGPFLFQAKFIASANAAGARPEPALQRAIAAEVSRIAKRLGQESGSSGWDIPPIHYCLFTNAVIGGAARKKIELKLRGVLPKTTIHIHDGTDVCNWLKISPQVVQAFPQLFSLRELFDFLREERKSGLSTRSETAAMMAREEAKVFVPTKAYFEAWHKLKRHAFVILEGPPEVGKTAIGRMIALAQLKQGWEAVECRHPKDFQDAYRSSTRQVFVADDFFGRTDYEPSRVSIWQDELPYILNRIDWEHWLILTSRAHLLQMGKNSLDIAGGNLRFPDPGEVIVDTGNLTRLEKAKILYRHAKASELNDEVKRILKQRVEEVVDHEHYTPLRIHRLVTTLSEYKS